MISLKLDTSAVNSLFAGQEARIELQQAVVAEICRRLFDKYVASDVTKLVDGIFSAHKTQLVEAVRDDASFRQAIEKRFEAAIAEIKANGFNRPVKLKPEFAEAVDKAVRDLVAKTIEEKKLSAEQLINDAIVGAVNRLTERAVSRIDDAVNKSVTKNVNEEIERRTHAALDKALKSA